MKLSFKNDRIRVIAILTMMILWIVGLAPNSHAQNRLERPNRPNRKGDARDRISNPKNIQSNQAESAEEADELDRMNRKQRNLSLPPEKQQAIEQEELRKQYPDRQYPHVKPEPILAPNGESLVGVVENRTLTKPQLDRRVALFLRNAEKIKDPIKREDQRILTESRILSDWKISSTLAVHAEKLGFSTNDQEIQDAFNKLSNESVSDPQKIQQRIQQIGIPEDELRQELHDAIVVEKMLQQHIKEKISEEMMREIFKTEKSVFLNPTTAHIWQIFLPVLNHSDPSYLKQKGEMMRELARKLRKCKDLNDLKELKNEIMLKYQDIDSNPDADVVLSVLENVQQDEPLPDELKRVIFNLKPGETSEVISTRELGLHVIKVVERTAGDDGSFESARPQIENYLIEKARDGFYENVKDKYVIKTRAAGLMNWREVPRETPKPNLVAGDTATSESVTLGNSAPAPLDGGASVPSVESVLKRKEQQKVQQVMEKVDAAPSAGGGDLAAPPPMQ